MLSELHGTPVLAVYGPSTIHIPFSPFINGIISTHYQKQANWITNCGPFVSRSGLQSVRNIYTHAHTVEHTNSDSLQLCYVLSRTTELGITWFLFHAEAAIKEVPPMSKEVDEPHVVSGCNTEIPVHPMQGMFE